MTGDHVAPECCESPEDQRGLGGDTEGLCLGREEVTIAGHIRVVLAAVFTRKPLLRGPRMGRRW